MPSRTSFVVAREARCDQENMIHQFVELGEFYRHAEGVDNDLAQFAKDPEQAFGSKTVLVLVFSKDGYEGIQVEEYDPAHCLWYLFCRPASKRSPEPTGTTAMPRWNPKKTGDFEDKVRTKLEKKLPKSAETALREAQDIEAWEREALETLAKIGSCVPRILNDIAAKHSDPKRGGVLTLGWRLPSGQLRRVGDFKAFQQSLVKAGRGSAFSMKTHGTSSAIGHCSICGARNVNVGGFMRIEDFKFYNPDKPGAISGGFDSAQAWRNFPVCTACSEKAQFSGERLRKNLTFDYYGFQYLILPSVVLPNRTFVHELIGRLCQARINRTAAARLTDAEDEFLWAVAQERNVVQLDMLFFDPRGRSFRPALHVSGLLPSHFRALFEARDRVDAHPWLRRGVKGSMLPKPYSFGVLRQVLAGFDAEFLEATRAALMRRSFGDRTLMHFGMQLARQDFASGGNWRQRIGALYASMLFFEELTSSAKGGTLVTVQFGNSPQAERVRRVLTESNGALRENPEAQAAFVTGACCKRIEQIQQNELGSAPFREKYKALKLTQKDVRQLFVDASAKAQAYEDQEHIVSGLLACAAEAFRASPDEWSLAPDEVSFYFALGLALAGRFAAKDSEGQENADGAKEIKSE